MYTFINAFIFSSFFSANGLYILYIKTVPIPISAKDNIVNILLNSPFTPNEYVAKTYDLLVSSGLSVKIFEQINPYEYNQIKSWVLETVQSIFDSYDQSKSETITEGFSSSYISKKIIARDQNNNDLGTIYTVAGKNDYGNISLMVAIKGDSIYRIKLD